MILLATFVVLIAIHGGLCRARVKQVQAEMARKEECEVIDLLSDTDDQDEVVHCAPVKVKQVDMNVGLDKTKDALGKGKTMTTTATTTMKPKAAPRGEEADHQAE